MSNVLLRGSSPLLTLPKIESRNRMSLKMLCAMVRIKSYLFIKSKCCSDLIVTQNMLSNFNFDMYQDVKETHYDEEELDDKD